MKLECSGVLWVLREAWEALSWKPCFPKVSPESFSAFLLEKYATVQFSQPGIPDSWSLFFFLFFSVGLII